MTSKLPTYSDYKASGIDWLGDIPSHWECVKSQYIFSLASGETINGEDFSKGGLYPVYGGNGIRGYHDKYNLEGKHILIGRVGALCGNIHITPEKSWVSEHALIATPLKQVNLHWLSSLLETMKLGQYSMASAQPVIAASNVGKLHIPIPPIYEQKVIAAYLDDVTGKVDALIEEKRKQVEDTRAYRTSIITETVTRGLNPDAPLRPSGIDWLGDIPEHWITSKLKYIGEARNGLTYSPDDICEQGKGVLVLRSSNIQNEQLCLEDNVYVSKKVDELMMNEGDILICSRNGSASLVGKCAIIPKGINASFGAFMMRYRSIINKRYTLYLVRTTLAQHKAQFATSTINQLTNAMIGNMQVAVPPLAEQQAIADFLDAKTAKIDELIGELTKQIDELTEYKQAVITEAVTGKVDVRDYKPSN